MFSQHLLKLTHSTHLLWPPFCPDKEAVDLETRWPGLPCVERSTMYCIFMLLLLWIHFVVFINTIPFIIVLYPYESDLLPLSLFGVVKHNCCLPFNMTMVQSLWLQNTGKVAAKHMKRPQRVCKKEPRLASNSKGYLWRKIGFAYHLHNSITTVKNGDGSIMLRGCFVSTRDWRLVRVKGKLNAANQRDNEWMKIREITNEWKPVAQRSGV